MSTVASKTLPSAVLMVDDESVARTLLEYYLTKNGHRPVVADSAAAARRLIAELGPGSIDCVVTDYNMPGESGLELLLWLKQTDPTLAVIMITATTERETVAATLRGGASDFLDKPISEAKLASAVTSGIAATAQSRRLAESDQAVRQVSETQSQMFGLSPESAAHIRVCFHPCHAAGGDFVNYFQLTPERFHVLTADVSGHDMHAAFVSAFFQGLARGMIEAGQPVTDVLERFNRFLIEESRVKGHSAGPTRLDSLCACVVSVDLAHRSISLWNHGMPRTREISSTGRISPSPSRVEAPLGWFDEINSEMVQGDTPEGGYVFVWTDGLEDLATDLQVSPCSLATGLLRAQLNGKEFPQLARAKDDILSVRIHLSGRSTDAAWFPVLYESYHGNQTAGIDEFSAHWERSLKMALPELPDARLFDVLLTLRETVLNGMKHGCGGLPDKRCHLTVSADIDERIVRVMVSDEGPGHNYDWIAHQQSDTLVDLHRGLALIHRIATHVASARRGAELTLDFSY